MCNLILSHAEWKKIIVEVGNVLNNCLDEGVDKNIVFRCDDRPELVVSASFSLSDLNKINFEKLPKDWIFHKAEIVTKKFDNNKIIFSVVVYVKKFL